MAFPRFPDSPSSSGVTRRDFLSTAGAALSGLAIGSRVLSAKQIGGRSASDFVHVTPASDRLYALVATALSAAKDAGATYADVRIARQHMLFVSLHPSGGPSAEVGTSLEYSVRALVDGAFAFRYGNLLSDDSVRQTARTAVGQARGFAKLGRAKAELAPAPVVRGVWSAPYTVDPFAVPIVEQASMLGALSAAAQRVEGAGGRFSVAWRHETRVCGTSDGSLTTQTFLRADPYASVFADWVGNVFFPVPDLVSRQAGYELFLAPDLAETVVRRAEEAKRFAALPGKPLDVGRYPVILDGQSMATTAALLLGPALQMDRVLRYEAAATGTSILAPPDEILGQPLLSPKLSITADRSVRNMSGAQWDDECVVPETTPLIVQGRVVDYLTDRQTAPALARWYKAQGKPVRSNGYAMSGAVDRPITVGSGALTIAPSASSASMEDLCRDVKRGVLMLYADAVRSDQQLATGFFTDWGGQCTLCLIENGRITQRIKNTGVQFRTREFWKGLLAVGDSRTMRPVSIRSLKGLPWQNLPADANAPAGYFQSADVISLTRG